MTPETPAFQPVACVAERWVSVAGFEGAYEVSDRGNVRTLLSTRFRRLLSLRTKNKGYIRVTLSRRGAYRKASVHTLVADAFLGPRPSGMVIRHLDGDCLNNSVANLAYGTPQDNENDKRLHGTTKRGASHAMAKLTLAQVQEIRGGDETSTSLSRRFGVSACTVRHVRRGYSWKHERVA